MDLHGIGNLMVKAGPPAPVQDGSTAAEAKRPGQDQDREREGLVRAAREFEAVFLNQLMQAMRKTVPDNELFNSKGPTKLYRQMQDAEMAKAMASQHGGLGIADLIVQQLSGREDMIGVDEAGEGGTQPLGPSVPGTGMSQYRRMSRLSGDTEDSLRLHALAERQGRAVADTLQRFEPEFRHAADDSGLPPELLLAVVMEESGGDPRAESPKGARGLMQLMPATAEELGVADPAHPGQNLQGGARYLARLLDKYDGDLDLALAAYNAGPGNVDRAGRKIPDFRETRNYVQRVTSRFRRLGGTDLASQRQNSTGPGSQRE